MAVTAGGAALDAAVAAGVDWAVTDAAGVAAPADAAPADAAPADEATELVAAGLGGVSVTAGDAWPPEGAVGWLGALPVAVGVT